MLQVAYGNRQDKSEDLHMWKKNVARVKKKAKKLMLTKKLDGERDSHIHTLNGWKNFSEFSGDWE